jgi:hypothetical protein
MSAKNNEQKFTVTFMNGAENPVPKLTATFPNGRQISVTGPGAVMLRPVFEAMATDPETTDNEITVLQIHSNPPTHLKHHMSNHRHQKLLKTDGIKFDTFE